MISDYRQIWEAAGYAYYRPNEWHVVDSDLIMFIKECYCNKTKFVIPMKFESITTMKRSQRIATIKEACNNDELFIRDYVILHTSSMDLRAVLGTIWEHITVTGSFLANWTQPLAATNILHDVHKKTKTFLCFNRVLRPWRIKFVSHLVENDLIKSNHISFFKEVVHTAPSSNYISHIRNFSKIDQGAIIDAMSSFGGDLYLDNIDPMENQAQTPCPEQFYEESFFSLVTETHFAEDDVFFSEKIFKPIMFKQPFLLVGSYQSLHFLRKMGFRTFDQWFDTSYDNIRDPYERMDAIVAEVVKIDSYPLNIKRAMFEKMRKDCEHNYSVLTDNADELIWGSSNISEFI